VSRTVGKFVTLNNHQIAGHVANLDFWKLQTTNALDALDGYSKRQMARERAQKKYINEHDTVTEEQLMLQREFPEYKPIRVAPDRHRIDSETLQTKRREVVDAFYRFLLRCHKVEFISREEAKQELNDLGIGIEPGDFLDE
jgi:hypothetical protein